ncbi:MAG: hypothetical protein ABSF32_06420 [Ignavibacteria bacterium]|jgi:hypothetical protein
MKRINLFLAFALVTLVLGYTKQVNAQNTPVLYFCEQYVSSGEISISDRFHVGYLTVMVKCDYELGLRDVSIQFDKYNCSTRTFEYYKKFDYTIKPDMKYVYFERNSDSDMSFDDPGIYRVYLLDNHSKTVTSGLIEIIR